MTLSPPARLPQSQSRATAPRRHRALAGVGAGRPGDPDAPATATLMGSLRRLGSADLGMVERARFTRSSAGAVGPLRHHLAQRSDDGRPPLGQLRWVRRRRSGRRLLVHGKREEQIGVRDADGTERLCYARASPRWLSNSTTHDSEIYSNMTALVLPEKESGTPRLHFQTSRQWEAPQLKESIRYLGRHTTTNDMKQPSQDATPLGNTAVIPQISVASSVFCGDQARVNRK